MTTNLPAKVAETVNKEDRADKAVVTIHHPGNVPETINQQDRRDRADKAVVITHRPGNAAETFNQQVRPDRVVNTDRRPGAEVDLNSTRAMEILVAGSTVGTRVVCL